MEKALTEQEQQDWVRDHYQAAVKYLAEKGLITESVVLEQSRYLIPLMAVWKLKLSDQSYLWVVNGDVPTDHVEENVADSARGVVRHFSLKWQMQVEELYAQDDKTQTEFADYLVSRAEGLYQLHNDEQLWG